MNKEDIIKKHCHVTINDDVDAQICDVEDAMDEWAKRQSIAFDEWRIQNRWFEFSDGYYHYTFEHGTYISNREYNKNYRKTREELYNLFFESQQKNG
jgi:hypothetical protein